MPVFITVRKLCGLVWLACLVVSGTARAAEAPPALHGTPEILEVKLAALRKAAASPAEEPLQSAFAELVQRKYAAGWPNLPAFARVLERDGRRALARGDDSRALSLLGFARDLAPSLLSPRLWLCWARLRTQPAHVAALAKEVAAAGRVWLSDYHHAQILIANVATGSFVVFGLVAFAILMLICARQWRYVAHDVSLLMPKGSSHWFAYALFVLLLGLPVALRFGVCSLAFVLFLIPFMHAEWRERAALSLAFIVLAFLPLLVEPIARTWVRTEGRAADLYALTRGSAPADALARIEKGGDTFASLIARGLVHKRRGEAELALELFERATKQQPTRGEGFVNYGAALFVLGRVDEAQRAFDRALALSPESIPALFNGARMFHRAGEVERGTVLLQRAQSINEQRTGALTAISRMIGPRFLAEELLPNADLWNAEPYAVERDMAHAVAQGVLPYLVGAREPLLFSAAAGAWLLFLLALAFSLRKLQLSLPCPRCGRPICLRVDTELPERSLCGQCYHAFVLQDVNTPSRIAKEVECRRHERMRTQLVTFGSIVLAGAGHILRGRSLVALPLVFAAGSALVLGLVAFTVLPLPFRSGDELFVPRLVIAGLVWLVAVAVALYTVPRKD